VREQHRRDVEVVLDEVSFCDSQLWPEGLVEVGQLDDLIANPDIEVVLVFWEFDIS
jgi:hypothetical protein